MSFTRPSYTGSHDENERLLLGQLRALTDGETNRIANLANASALLNTYLRDINWVGFYLLEGEELVLGPFQGLPACVRIPLGRGVCGASALRRETIVVPNVHEFPGHIACDAASNSEIVVPLFSAQDELVGVLDIDSPLKGRFGDEDARFLERFNELLSASL